MIERIFKRILYYLEKHPSRVLERLEIQILMGATARAFRQKGVCILFSRNPLQKYAEFTRDCMEVEVDRKRLYRVMYRLGRSLRKITGFTDPEDCRRLVFLLYRNIGITMTGNIPGEIQVPECYFSQVYSSSQCQMISAMDAGIIAGICGGKLKFSKRITEGCKCCKATVKA